ncbi:MAG: single-stranded DNA-binding protein [Bacteroidetes bacterium HGW-Bacteroidetes-14]|jgi:single-strand DNA-binding protein|nr:MAG: single-stranded DNA-binding protein [Bacteroidetes bacterium HGW-Bacteroidetes-14]
MSLNKVMLIGNAGKDPEVRHLENGSMVARFSLATTERYKDKNGDFQEQTEWHNIVCWRGLAERVEKYVKKGSQLFIEGRIRSNSWEDKTGVQRFTVEIVAENLQILGKRQDSAPAAQTQPNIQEIIPPDDGDLPF